MKNGNKDTQLKHLIIFFTRLLSEFFCFAQLAQSKTR